MFVVEFIVHLKNYLPKSNQLNSKTRLNIDEREKKTLFHISIESLFLPANAIERIFNGWKQMQKKSHRKSRPYQRNPCELEGMVEVVLCVKTARLPDHFKFMNPSSV